MPTMCSQGLAFVPTWCYLARGISQEVNMANERRHPNVVNLSELEGRSVTKGTRFAATMKHLGRATGAKGVGCTWYEQPPKHAAFPYHFHCANEESLFVLEGNATVRIGEEKVEVR